MIIMTEAAKNLFRMLRLHWGNKGENLRLDKARATAEGNGDEEPKLAVYLAEPEEGDHAVEHEDEPLLYISRKVSAAFEAVHGGSRGDD